MQTGDRHLLQVQLPATSSTGSSNATRARSVDRLLLATTTSSSTTAPPSISGLQTAFSGSGSGCGRRHRRRLSDPGGGGRGSGSVDDFSASSAGSHSQLELMSTERNYLRRLALLHSHYYPRLRQVPSAPAQQLDSVFSLYGTFWQMHRALLVELRVAELKRQLRTGHVMLKFGHLLRLYSDYYVNYKKHLQLVNDCMKDAAFRLACKAAQQECPNASDRKLDVTNHMMEPIQRPLRYPLLVRGYIKEIGQAHPDWSDAQRALALIESVTVDFDKKVMELENFQEMLVQLRDVAFPEELAATRVAFARSTFLLGARVTKISSKNQQQQRHLLLSSAWLLLCEVGPLGRKLVQLALPVGRDQEEEEEEDEEDEGSSLAVWLDAKLSADYRHSVRLSTRAKTYDLAFATASELHQWLAAFRKLGLPVEEAHSATGEAQLPWTGVAESDLARRRPAKVKDGDVSQCQMCSAEFTQLQRRHHCRLCGGVYCGSCSAYSSRVLWSRRQKRACCGCKDRVSRRDGVSSVLLAPHRDLMRRLNRRLSERQLSTPAHQAVLVEGYLRVRIDAPEPRHSGCPADLLGRWCRLWCCTDGRLLWLHRMKRDPAPLHWLVLLLELRVVMKEEVAEAGRSEELQLLVKDGRLETWRLRLPGREGGGGHRDLSAWHRCLNRASRELYDGGPAGIEPGELAADGASSDVSG